MEDIALLPIIEKPPSEVIIPNVEPGSAIYKICQKYPRLFQGQLSRTPAQVTDMVINLREGEPFPASMQERLRPIPFAYQAEVEKQLGEMLANDVIEEVRDAEYYSQLLVVRKKDQSLRLCIDFRGLNSITVRNRHPIPLIKDLVSKLQGQQVMGVLDLSQGYWQAALAPESRHLTTFATPQGLYRFKRVAFGLCNAPAHFQSVIQREVLGELHGKACLLYIDDILILGKSEAEFLSNLEAVLQRLEEKGISIKPSKCRLGVSTVEYVGLLISGDKVEMTPSRKKAISEIKLPKSVTKLRSFLGLLNYFRDHIRDFAALTTPLYNLISGNPGKRDIVNWTAETQSCFYTCREAAATSETLYHLRAEGEIRLRTDASNKAVGGVLTQMIDGKELPILFMSKKLSPAQQRYSTSDKEMIGVFYCIRAAHQLLAGRRFEVFTDHKALQSTKTSASARVERMKVALAEYDFTIHYIKGSDNNIADLMSRPDSDELQEEAGPAAVLAVAEERPIDRKQIILAHHNAFTGHLGRESTVEAIRASGFEWPGLQKDVAHAIAECAICQRGRPMAAMKPKPFILAAQGPNREWSADVMELEPVRGYSYILAVICNYSRFIHLTRMRSVNASETMAALEDLFLQFGSPERLRTDNGTNFKNESLSDLLRKYGVSVVAIAPYESRSNSIVERAIREVRRHLYGFVQMGYQWPDVVKQVQFIMNRTPHSATGFAPADILFGQINSLGYGPLTPMMKELLRRNQSDNMNIEERDNNYHFNGNGVGDRRSNINERDGDESSVVHSNSIPPQIRDLAAMRRQQAELQAAALENQARMARSPPVQNGRGPEVGDRVWVRVRLANKHAGREHWVGPAHIAAITGESRNGTEILTIRLSDGTEQRVTRAKIRKIPKDAILEERREGAAIVGCSSWEPNQPPEFYKLRIKRPDGSQTWEEASLWLRRPEFQEYALTEPYLNHLVFAVGDA